jgi:hypothetical protein
MQIPIYLLIAQITNAEDVTAMDISLLIVPCKHPREMYAKLATSLTIFIGTALIIDATNVMI